MSGHPHLPHIPGLNEPKGPKLWLPSTTMHVNVAHHDVQIHEHMTMELRSVPRPTGFNDDAGS